MADRIKGTVNWFNKEKGYGFIKPENGGKDIFCHFSAIDMPGFKELSENQAVEYEVESSDKGPRASRVRPVMA